MKAYIIYTIKDSVRKEITEIIEYIKNNLASQSVIFETATYDLSEENFDRKLPDIMKSIRKADFVVVENSISNDGIGYEVAIALNEKKPVVLLNNENIRKSLSSPFVSNDNKYLYLKKYKSIRDIEIILGYFLKELKYLIENKFILILSPQLDRYLEWYSKQRGIHKSEITRESIKKTMESDTVYKRYLKDNGLD